jgi:uncharacterized protein (TIGR03435 family)
VSVAAIACLTLIFRLAFAQTAPNHVSFEAASVKPVAADADDNMHGGPGTPDPGRITYTGLTFNMVIRIAYDVKHYQIDGPAWMDADKFEITATLPPHSTLEQFREMLQGLLAERFRMIIHREVKTFDAFALTVNKGGPKMQETEAEPPEVTAAWKGHKVPRTQLLGGHVRVTGNRQRLSGLATILENSVRRPVVDRTGLTGSYSFVLEFAEDRRPASAPADGLFPDLFGALAQQLGLTLQTTKAPLEVLVIDHVARTATAN